MNLKDERQFPRVGTCNLISYALLDQTGNMVHQGMGRALDVSQNGIYLETALKVTAEYISLMSSDEQNNLMELKGKVAYSKRNGNAKFRTGIAFLGSQGENARFAAKLIKSYHNRKNGLARVMAV